MSVSKIIKSLEEINSQYGTSYVLITKNIDLHSKFQIFNSSNFEREKISHLRSIIVDGNERYEENICEIKPVLKECYLLEISKKSTLQLFDQYYDLMSSLSQAVCKTIAKEWIKVAEPKKQALYPYKFYNTSKPPWWPAKVNHIEPDHLDKDSRINVLINILRNPSFDIQALKLRTSVLEFKYPITLRILNEIYYLAIYDRLFFGKGRENQVQAAILSKLANEEKDKINSDKIGVVVSDIRSASAGIRHRGLIMVRQIRESWLNNEIYLLNTLPNITGNTHEDVGIKEITAMRTPEVDDRKRKSSHISEEEKYATEDLKRHQTSESSLGNSPGIIHVKQDPDYLNHFKEFEYESMSQEIVNHLDSAMENYTSSPSSDDFYI
ncbi:uncharacterized protein AC631_00903 [Debaryomyces fabryi]|uniref:Subtelomeric hrmA-associated cluster protein AFUB-079030/YDR124W-like helical bundle domain-containing protein n=1 Tax=Debaryomyces fabryi TaxID=58627 RepID=A0A0V1Q4Z2_9ASCO|nr:uncharacterized protein AC631_00903 [Debaryomyces fabryi]KSA03418.1 hypothetical protein AC631_00903 [Debaryomyces fabryi]CUM50063.1 unnamed protein product [Debaryomyces fabryi]